MCSMLIRMILTPALHGIQTTSMDHPDPALFSSESNLEIFMTNSKSMKYLIIFIFLFGFQQMNAQKTEINWIGFEELEESLKKEVKPVVIYFYTDWCVYCKKMDRNAYKNPEIISILNNDFYAVKMNAESTAPIEFEGQVFTNEQARTQRNGIHQIPLLLAGRKNRQISFPVVMVLDKDFRVLRKSHEYLSSEKMKKLIKG